MSVHRACYINVAVFDTQIKTYSNSSPIFNQVKKWAHYSIHIYIYFYECSRIALSFMNRFWLRFFLLNSFLLKHVYLVIYFLIYVHLVAWDSLDHNNQRAYSTVEIRDTRSHNNQFITHSLFALACRNTLYLETMYH